MVDEWHGPFTDFGRQPGNCGGALKISRLGFALRCGNDCGYVGLQLGLNGLGRSRYRCSRSLSFRGGVSRGLNVLLGLVDDLNQIRLGGMQFVCRPARLLGQVAIPLDPVLQRCLTAGLKRARRVDERPFHGRQDVPNVVLRIQLIEKIVGGLRELHLVTRPRRHAL
ncbi:hypothetical protein [Mycobacterium xenopi]|uniref:hypothetical protein n=1 Tax=Mycobacterium xenopi TaxID=1789 RepID=UPI001FD494EB|nr:hypothetical protein [Mycobacterium xenopi]